MSLTLSFSLTVMGGNIGAKRINKARWTQQEDEKLRMLAEKYGMDDFQKIASFFEVGVFVLLICKLQFNCHLVKHTNFYETVFTFCLFRIDQTSSVYKGGIRFSAPSWSRVHGPKKKTTE